MHAGFLGTFDFKLQKELGNCIKKRSRLAIQRTGGDWKFFTDLEEGLSEYWLALELGRSGGGSLYV